MASYQSFEQEPGGTFLLRRCFSVIELLGLQDDHTIALATYSPHFKSPAQSRIAAKAILISSCHEAGICHFVALRKKFREQFPAPIVRILEI